MLYAGEAEGAEFLVLQTEDLLMPGDLFQETVEAIDLRTQLIAVRIGDELITALTFQPYLFIAKDFADLTEPFVAKFC
jgi:hypothetical protein